MLTSLEATVNLSDMLVCDERDGYPRGNHIAAFLCKAIEDMPEKWHLHVGCVAQCGYDGWYRLRVSVKLGNYLSDTDYERFNSLLRSLPCVLRGFWGFVTD